MRHMSMLLVVTTIVTMCTHMIIRSTHTTTHRIVMNQMSNTATTLTLILTKTIATTLILTKTMTTRHTSTMLILTMHTLILTTHTLMMPTAIIMARVSPSRRSRPRRLGSWWRR